MLVLIFLWEKLVGANFYAFCNYGPVRSIRPFLETFQMFLKCLIAKSSVAANIKLIIQGGLSVCPCLPQKVWLNVIPVLFSLLKLSVYATFLALFQLCYNINLIIQDELTACQCLLLFITLDETGN